MNRSSRLYIEALESRALMASDSVAGSYPMVQEMATSQLAGESEASNLTDQLSPLDAPDQDGAAHPHYRLIAFFMDPGYKLELSVVNLRTGQQVQPMSEVWEGDVLEVKLVGERAEIVSHALSQLVSDPHFKVIDERTGMIQAESAGEFKIRFAPILEASAEPIFVLTGKRIEFFQRPLEELLSPLTRTVTVRANSDRPSATNETFAYQPFEGLTTARDLSGLLQKPETLTFRVDDSRGLLKDDTSKQLRSVVIGSPKRGSLLLNADGSFNYAVDHQTYDNSLYEFLKQGDEFSYAVVGPQGMSDVRKVQIRAAELPLLDLTMKIVDSNGNEIHSIAVGQEFTLEISAFSNTIYHPTAPDYLPFQTLRFRYSMDGDSARSLEPPRTPDLFQWERFSLGQENDQLVLNSEFVGPGFIADGRTTRANFDRYTLDLQEVTLLRQKMISTRPGPIQFSLDNASLNLDSEVAKMIHVVGTTLEVTNGSSVTGSMKSILDVSGDKNVSALDALLIINRLNASTDAEFVLAADTSLPFDVCDVDLNGRVTPLDALLVINWVNAHSSSSGEAEAAAAFAPAGIADSMFDEDLASKRRRLNTGRSQ